jgi:hypothetical protein
MDLGLKASFTYWNPAQSGTFGSSPRVKDRERNNYKMSNSKDAMGSNHEVASRTRYSF